MIETLLLAVLAPLLAPQEEVAEEPRTPTELYLVADRAGRLARDRHLSFGGRTGERARDTIIRERQKEESAERPAALIALGCAGDLGDAALLERYATEGNPADRRAAIFALGELGAAGRAPLQRLVASGPVAFEEYVVLAWILSDRDVAAREVATLANDPDSPLNEAASRLLAFAQTGVPPADVLVIDDWLELRWSAARRFGMVQGRRWKDLLLAELLGNEEFLDRVVLGAAAHLDRPSVRDHLFEIALEGGRPGALPAAVVAMPEALGAALEAGIWSPANLEEWKIILREIEDRRIEKKARVILEHAVKTLELEDLASIQLLRAGGELPTAWLNHQLYNAPMEQRALVIEATADRGEVSRIGELLKYLEPGTPRKLQASALIALARLGHDRSIEVLISILDGGQTVERREVLVSIGRQLHDRRFNSAVADALDHADLDPEVRFDLEVNRALHGRLRDRRHLREWLQQGLRDPIRRDVVRGLSNRVDHDDLSTLRDLFPVEDDMDVNVELAIALLRYREPAVLVVLREALWGSCWNRGVVAGGLFAHAVSIHGLVDEVESPPAGVSEAALRRVGFAIGEWGGLAIVDSLALRRTESDPVLQGAYLGALSTQTH